MVAHTNRLTDLHDPALPESHEVIAGACEEVGRKAVAAAIGVSAALVHKWAEPAGVTESGALNPLDRALRLCTVTRSHEPARWLCSKLGGFFVPSPTIPLSQSERDQRVFDYTRSMVAEFAELLTAVSESGKEVDQAEATKIRAQWEDLKLCGEGFVVACERGHFSAEGEVRR